MFKYNHINTVYSDIHMNAEKDTTIRVHTSTKEELEKLKIIPEEPFDRVIRRLIASSREKEGIIA